MTKEKKKNGMTRSTKQKRPQTRESVLEATKELVALKGPASTTVRDITEASGANVAAVNYHFQSKEELVSLAFFEILDALNTERRRKLDSYIAEAGDAPVSPRDLLDALIEPILRVSRGQDGGSLYVRSAYQMRTAQYASLSHQNNSQFRDVAEHFVEAIMRALDIDREEAIWRYEFARGAALHLFINLDPIWRRHETFVSQSDDLLTQKPTIELNKTHIDRIIDTILPSFTA